MLRLKKAAGVRVAGNLSAGFVWQAVDLMTLRCCGRVCEGKPGRNFLLPSEGKMKGLMGRAGAALRSFFGGKKAEAAKAAMQLAKQNVSKVMAEATANTRKVNKALNHLKGPGVPNYQRQITKKRIADVKRLRRKRWINSPARPARVAQYHTQTDANRALRRLNRYSGKNGVPQWMLWNAELATRTR